MHKKRIELFMETVRRLVFDGSPLLLSEAGVLLDGLIGKEKTDAFLEQFPDFITFSTRS